MVISIASPAAETHSPSERHCDHEQSARRTVGWMSVSVLDWYPGAGNIHLLKSCHCSAASHCCVITWSQEREEWRSGLFCALLTLSPQDFYPLLSENHLCSPLVCRLLFAALIFHYLQVSFSPSPFISSTGFSFSHFL